MNVILIMLHSLSMRTIIYDTVICFVMSSISLQNGYVTDFVVIFI